MSDFSADADIPASDFTPDDRGIPTSAWSTDHLNEAANPVEVRAWFPGHNGQIAKGLLREWIHANESQRHSLENQTAFDSVNRDILGPDTPAVFPTPQYPAQ